MGVEKVKIAEGLLTWEPIERVSGRYGSVFVSDKDSQDGDACPESKMIMDNLLPMAGRKGKLIAKVIKTRRSTHLGDAQRGYFPSTPDVGDEYVIGDGVLAYQTKMGLDMALIMPENMEDAPKNYPHMDPYSLYRCHEQIVELWFQPD